MPRVAAALPGTACCARAAVDSDAFAALAGAASDGRTGNAEPAPAMMLVFRKLRLDVDNALLPASMRARHRITGSGFRYLFDFQV